MGGKFYFKEELIFLMKLMKELSIIFLVTLLGEVISYILPIAIPSSIIALLLMLILFLSKIIKPETIETSSNWILSNMAIFFIPACVSIIDHLNLLLSAWWQILVISIISFLLTFIAAGYTVVLIQKLMAKRGKDNV